MHSLLIDTSTEKCFVAIANDSELIFHSQIPSGFQSAQLLLPELQKGLEMTSLQVKDLDFICAGVGPGSYTGMRVGATIAKTIAFTTGVPLVGVCSLDLFVPADTSVEVTFAAVIDAKIGGLYIQSAKYVDGVAIPFALPGVYPLSESLEHLSAVQVIVSPNFGRWRSQLEAMKADCSWDWEENYPSPNQMLRVALEKHAAKDYSLDGRLELLYMRKTQAEIEKKLFPS